MKKLAKRVLLLSLATFGAAQLCIKVQEKSATPVALVDEN